MIKGKCFGWYLCYIGDAFSLKALSVPYVAFLLKITSWFPIAYRVKFKFIFMTFKDVSNIYPICWEKLVYCHEFVIPHVDHVLLFFHAFAQARYSIWNPAQPSPSILFQPGKISFYPCRTSLKRLFSQHPLCSDIYVDPIISSTESYDYIHHVLLISVVPTTLVFQSTCSINAYWEGFPLERKGKQTINIFIWLVLNKSKSMPCTMRVENWGYKKHLLPCHYAQGIYDLVGKKNFHIMQLYNS